MTTIHFAICADRNMEIGLHVTLHSALSSLNASSEAVAHLFLNNFETKRVQALKLTLQEFANRCEIKVYDAATIDVGKGRGLHGNKMVYVLFQIPNFVNAERVLCLDSDLLITTDVTELFQSDLEGNAIAVVSEGEVKNCWSKERDLLISVGVSERAAYFNTGVVLVDVAEWKRQDITSKCLDFAASHANHLFNTDQTVLNAVLRDRITLLPGKYNLPHYPTNPVLKVSDAGGIHHFVGSPKPWDFLGEVLHLSYPAFQKHLLLTHHRDYKSFKNLSVPQLFRAIRLSRSYYKTLKALLRERKGV
jgi:lipopolysaccharide biosynthesis glycosyltransferase